MLVKAIIAYYKEDVIEKYMIMIDFEKAYNRIYMITMEKTLRAMNVSETIIEILKILHVESENIVITNNEKGERLVIGGIIR